MKARFFEPNPYCSSINLSIKISQSQKILTTKIKLRSDYEKNFSDDTLFYYFSTRKYSFGALNELLKDIGTRIKDELQDPVELVHEINISIIKKSQSIYHIHESKVSKENTSQILFELGEYLTSHIENNVSNSKCTIS